MELSVITEGETELVFHSKPGVVVDALEVYCLRWGYDKEKILDFISDSCDFLGYRDGFETLDYNPVNYFSVHSERGKSLEILYRGGYKDGKEDRKKWFPREALS
jgi:hypothetical protein